MRFNKLPGFFQRHLPLAVIILAVGFVSGQRPESVPRSVAATDELWKHVTVVRTTNGVPHIRAKDLRSAGYALAWLQLEDHGSRTAISVLSSSGRAASVFGYERLDGDFIMLRERRKRNGKYNGLSKDVREVYEGFAAGINRFVSLHPSEFPTGMPTNFTGLDVAMTEAAAPNARKIANFVKKLTPDSERTQTQDAVGEGAEDEGEDGPDDGSNAWAFAPSRTKSGKAILMRNPHLNWNAGYYEAHITVPGIVDFYGDFRIGGPFAVIGGFNRNLGFSTTNNQQDLDEFYALGVDPAKPDAYLLDGKSYPLTRELITAEFKNGEGVSTETREFWSTEFGPVVYRGNGKIFILKYAGDGEIKAGEQFLKMMRASSLAEWQNAMRMRARLTSNFTYADRAGNIHYLWNASLPLLPHEPVDDLTAVEAKSRKDIWSNYVPYESLPQVLNPPGGYVHNENSSHHYTNVRRPVVTKNAYPNFEEPRLSLRSQLAIQLIDVDEKFSLEDVARLKHNYRALLADRVKGDLIAAAKATDRSDAIAGAIQVLERWDNTTAPESRGAVLFELWWQHYSGLYDPEQTLVTDEKRFAQVWTVSDPFNTPRGLADPRRSAASLIWAVEEVKKRYGRVDVAWGDIHRVRRGAVDAPVGGCGNDLGCFRILSYRQQRDGKLAAVGGDCWVLAVEFGDTPRAYSVLAYGQSSRPESPFYDDQAEMFAKGEMKKVAFTEDEIAEQAIGSYRPGETKVR